MKFKVGDLVQSKQKNLEYKGEIISFGKEDVTVLRDDGKNWLCKLLKNGEIATAYGIWDGKSKLIKIESYESEVSMKNIKYGVKYDRDTDPVEFFKSKPQAKKRIQELLDDPEVKKESIYLFQVGTVEKVQSLQNFELVKV